MEGVTGDLNTITSNLNTIIDDCKKKIEEYEVMISTLRLELII